MGVSIRVTVRNAAKLAVYEQNIISVKMYQPTETGWPVKSGIFSTQKNNKFFQSLECAILSYHPQTLHLPLCHYTGKRLKMNDFPFIHEVRVENNNRGIGEKEQLC